MVTFLRKGLVKMTLRLIQPLSVLMTMTRRLLRQFRRSLQIKKIVPNARRVLSFAEQPKYTYQSIVKKGWVLEHLRLKLKKLLKLHRKKSNKLSMVSFIHNGGEITTQMEYNFKTKSPKSRATFLRETSFLNFKLQIIRLVQGHQSCTPTH